jgi:hypothetical protein
MPRPAHRRDTQAPQPTLHSRRSPHVLPAAPGVRATESGLGRRARGRAKGYTCPHAIILPHPPLVIFCRKCRVLREQEEEGMPGAGRGVWPLSAVRDFAHKWRGLVRTTRRAIECLF